MKIIGEELAHLSNKRLAFFDIEADGLKPTHVHCLVITDADTGAQFVFRTDKGVSVYEYTGPSPIKPRDISGQRNLVYSSAEKLGRDAIDLGVRLLETYGTVVAHYGLGYDAPVLVRLHDFKARYPQSPSKAGPKIRDSLVLTRLFFSHVREAIDFDAALLSKAAREKAKGEERVLTEEEVSGLFPGRLIGAQGLEAWGHRLGMHKGDYAKSMAKLGLDPWAAVNDHMVEYCRADVDLLHTLWHELIRVRLIGHIHDFNVQVVTRLRIRATTAPGGWTVEEHKGRVSFEGEELRAAAASEDGYNFGARLFEHVVELKARRCAERQLREDEIEVGNIHVLDIPGFCSVATPVPRPGYILVTVPRFDEIVETKSADLLAKLMGQTTRRACRIDRTVKGTEAELIATLKQLWLWESGPTASNAIELEHEMAVHMKNLEEDGVHLDIAAARALEESLRARKKELADQILKYFPPRVVPKKWVLRQHIPQAGDGNLGKRPELYASHKEQLFYNPKSSILVRQNYNSRRWIREYWGDTTNPKTNKKIPKDFWVPTSEDIARDPHVANIVGVNEGERTPITIEHMNLNSRLQIAVRLMDMGWIPNEFTATGLPDLSDAALEGAAEKYPVAQLLRAYFLVDKRLAMIATGTEAWLRLADPVTHKLHPRINALGAVTMRATHSKPNISQVPAVKNKKVDDPSGEIDAKTGKVRQKEAVAWGEEGGWGAECRQLFVVPSGWTLVGADLAGLELRCFAHYLAKYDGGLFGDVLQTTDVHEHNRKIMGTPNRTHAKRFIFALLYGAGDEKLGEIFNPGALPSQKKALGALYRARIAEGLVGFKELTKEIRTSARQGALLALDGRIVPVRAQHAALNTLLQSLGALIAKYWIVEVMNQLTALGLKRGWDGQYTMVIWSHDEIQLPVKDMLWTDVDGKEKPLKEIVRRVMLDAAPVVGRALQVRIPILADSKTGQNWFATH